MKDLSVLLVDNHPLFAQLLTRFFQSEEQVHVVGTTTQDETALRTLHELTPDMVLIDLDNSVKNSLETITRMRAALPECLIIAMTLRDAAYYRNAVLEAGADDLILKTDISSNFLLYMHARLEKRKRGKIINLRGSLPVQMPSSM